MWLNTDFKVFLFIVSNLHYYMLCPLSWKKPQNTIEPINTFVCRMEVYRELSTDYWFINFRLHLISMKDLLTIAKIKWESKKAFLAIHMALPHTMVWPTESTLVSASTSILCELLLYRSCRVIIPFNPCSACTVTEDGASPSLLSQYQSPQ